MPTRLMVSNIMRVASEEPLMDAVPAHNVACGMLEVRFGEGCELQVEAGRSMILQGH